MLKIPFCLLTDSYKTTHVDLYPESIQMTAYAEFRTSFESDESDTRIIFYGIRYVIENYIAHPWSVDDINRAQIFFNTHNNNSPFPFPKELFLKFIRENNGFFPVKIQALPEGSVIYPHVPVYQITARNEYSRLVTYLETILTMVWYPSTVATLSRRCRTHILESYQNTVDPDSFSSINSRLHDFGFRGCTSVEQSIIGGVSHLLNFTGSDTLSACYYAQFHLNNGNPVGFSIPATEHSIMISYKTETEAMTRFLELYGSGACACVMDSYDYAEALEKVLPSVASLKIKKGGFLVIRPDSGDPIMAVLMGLRAADSVFGSKLNTKGFKVINGAGVIQGDGVSNTVIKKILKNVEKEGFSAENVAFGMGGGLLQKVNRDTMSFATKLNKIVYADGTSRNVMKMPKGEKSKFSLPGELAVYRDENQLPIVYPSEYQTEKVPLLQTVYDNGKVIEWETFDVIRTRVSKEWENSPLHFDPISEELKEKIEQVIKEHRV